MATTGRPKRAAALKKVVVITSDSEEDEIPSKKKVLNNNDADASYLDSDVELTPKKARKTVRKSPKPRIKVDPEDKPAPKKRGRPKAAVEGSEAKKRAAPAKRRKVASIKDEPVDECMSTNKENEIDVVVKEEIDGGCMSTTKSKETKPIFPSNSKGSNPFSLTKPKDFNFSSNYRKPWNEPQLLSEIQNIDYHTSMNIIKLFKEENTIPFMCRYRKELIGDLSPDDVRDIKISYNHILNIQAKSETIIKHLAKDNNLTDEIRDNLLCAKSLDELDHLYAPYKPASKASLAERAKSLGLQEPAEQLLYGQPCQLDMFKLVNLNVEGLESIDKISEGMKHIIAHTISKDTKVLEEIRKLEKIHRIMLQSSLSKAKSETKPKTTKTTKPTTKSVAIKKDEKPQKHVDPSKFENYFDFKNGISYIKPHQILAVNRGENLKVLTVKILVPDSFKNDLCFFVRREYLQNGIFYKDRGDLFQAAFEEAYTKKLQPLICRQIRGELTKIAEKASVEVFATNLKQLLLMSPVKGEKILGIDPGFSNGCKIALISECAEVLDTDVIYPHTQPDNYIMYGERIALMLRHYNCKVIGLGNGTACRETEAWISDLYKNNILDPKIVRYSIVTEQGASIYSCGDIAKKEFPDLDVNLISAVSIARRLNDPLCEFVKVEPKHLGVGMYQHDINEKLLSESLNEVVMECVSFVGVDINTASVALLKHVAGLTSVRAENIIKYRAEKGPFKSREELKKVKQIGEKTFVQCAGFIRIEPLTAGIQDYNLLDSTWVHPESYDLAEQIIKKCYLTMKQIGSKFAIEKIKEFACLNSLEKLAKDFNKPEERIKSVLDALQRELLRDYRADFDKKPLFKQGLTKMSDLQQGTTVTGAITNITHFGCFVDIGVEKDGLIHVSQLRGMKPVIGDRIEANVTDVDVARGRIQLRLQNIL